MKKGKRKLSKNFNEVKCNKNKHDHFWHRVTKEQEQDFRKQIRGWEIFREDGLNLDKTLIISQELAEGKTIKEISQKININVKHIYSFVKENKIAIHNSYIKCAKKIERSLEKIFIKLILKIEFIKKCKQKLHREKSVIKFSPNNSHL